MPTSRGKKIMSPEGGGTKESSYSDLSIPLVRIKEKKLARLGILFNNVLETNKASLRENTELN